MLRSKLALLVALGTLILSGNIRADVVGLTTTNASGTYSGSGNSFTILTYVLFTTTSNAGNRFTGVQFSNLGLSTSQTLLVTLEKNNGVSYQPVATQNITSSNTSKINFGTGLGSIGSYKLEASSDYLLYIKLSSDATIESMVTGTNGNITNNISDWVASANQFGINTNGAALSLYTSVPEPGTLILTGSALAAGAVGAYFKRRRKARTEAESAA